MGFVSQGQNILISKVKIKMKAGLKIGIPKGILNRLVLGVTNI